MNTSTGDRWLTVDEIASYLGVKRDTVYKWIERRKLPAQKMGRLWRFKIADVEKWIKSGGSASQPNQ